MTTPSGLIFRVDENDDMIVDGNDICSFCDNIFGQHWLGPINKPYQMLFCDKIANRERWDNE